MNKFLFLFLVPVHIGSAQQSDISSDKLVQRIAFGSCNNPKHGECPVVPAAVAKKPDLFLFLGDNIYGDTTDMELLKKKYAELLATDTYKKLKATCPILATWDDHDFGANDSGKNYSKRKESEVIFLDTFEDPADTPRRKRDGIYQSYLYGPAGKRVQILLLDTRYFRDPLPRSKKKKTKDTVGWYEPTKDTSMTLLGKDQWKWLEEQLQVKADIRIIASSIQMIAHEKGMENWGNVPHERQRLFDLLKKYKANHTFAISGDVHYTELSKMMIGNYPYYALTSSGMTHPHKGWANAKNSFRVGNSSFEKSLGWIDINWDKKAVTLQGINEKGKALHSHTVKLDELEFKE